MKYWIMLLSILILLSCEDVISVEDISRERMIILAPSANATVSERNVNFSWELMEFATRYDIQVARPDFSNAERFLVDSVVVDTTGTTRFKIGATLEAGNYEWRVRAVNSGYKTDYETAAFSVTGSATLKGQTIVLSSPNADMVIEGGMVDFSWERNAVADLYRFKLIDKEQGTILLETTTPETKYDYTFTQSATYIWQVRAENESEITDYSSREVTIELN